MGKEKQGWVPGYGLGVTPSMMWGASRIKMYISNSSCGIVNSQEDKLRKTNDKLDKVSAMVSWCWWYGGYP